jgi:outer membrane protein assembly factor BamE (lipoprotein component of BamABCDE complex)
MRISAALLLLSCVGLLGACANPRLLVPGQATEADVRARMGKPTDTLVDRNGERIWDYATGPEGLETYRVRFGPDGKVKDVTQLLTEEQLDKIVVGESTQADVRLLFGRPWEEAKYMPGLTWTWRYSRIGSIPGWLIVTFNPDGTVRDKIAVVEQTDDDGDPN